MRLLPFLLLACAPEPFPVDHAGPPAIRDLLLTVGVVEEGERAHIRVDGAQAGEVVFIGVGVPGPGVCPPQLGGGCLDIAGPVRLIGPFTADGFGQVDTMRAMPGNPVVGDRIAIQAGVVRGGQGIISQEVRKTISDGSFITTADLDPGDLVITEFLPQADWPRDRTEWIEFFNTTEQVINLDGLELWDQDTGLIATLPGLLLDRKDYIVIGNSTGIARNGGAFVDFDWGGRIMFDNDDLQLRVQSTGVQLDRVAWTPLTFPLAYAEAIELGVQPDADANDDPANWCISSFNYGITQRVGSPGIANDVCP